MSGFQSMHDDSPVHLADRVRAALAANPDVLVHVGSDSHSRGEHTIYATAVVLRYHCNGAQVLYRREKGPRIRDLWTRLWGEVERSIAVAADLRACNIPVREIDMDLNSDPHFGSHKLHASAIGYVRSLGYRARTKPELLMATWAANVLCNGRYKSPVA
jgi:predicted RNase H-related nuclease YkuK (DUF458 family)